LEMNCETEWGVRDWGFVAFVWTVEWRRGQTAVNSTEVEHCLVISFCSKHHICRGLVLRPLELSLKGLNHIHRHQWCSNSIESPALSKFVLSKLRCLPCINPIYTLYIWDFVWRVRWFSTMKNQKYILYMCANTLYICVRKNLREILIWTGAFTSLTIG